tara:strand:+ start:181 stop:1020 length:840 start_codon:yes stop_codon:yes gene_type:complete
MVFRQLLLIPLVQSVQIKLEQPMSYISAFPLYFLLTVSLDANAFYFSETAVQSISDKTWEQMKASFPISNNLMKRLQIECIASKVIQQLDEPFSKYEWEIELFENPTANAFALANGKIGIYTGLYSVASNQDELATIIGHEVAHVTSKHSHKKINRKILSGFTTAISEVAISDIIANHQTQSISMMTEILATYGFDLPFERTQEIEADIEGLRLMAEAGFNPLASLDVWKKMQEKGNALNLEFLASHPLGRNRRKILARQLSTPIELYAQTKRKPSCSY